MPIIYEGTEWVSPPKPDRRRIRWIRALLYNPVLGLVGMLIIAGIQLMGVLSIKLGQTLLGLALLVTSIEIFAATLHRYQKTWKAIGACAGALLIGLVGLWYLNARLEKRNVMQDSANRAPIIRTSPLLPKDIRIQKSKAPRKIEQSGTGNAAVGGNISQAPCSTAQVGNGNSSVTNCTFSESVGNLGERATSLSHDISEKILFVQSGHKPDMPVMEQLKGEELLFRTFYLRDVAGIQAEFAQHGYRDKKLDEAMEYEMRNIRDEQSRIPTVPMDRYYMSQVIQGLLRLATMLPATSH